MRRDILSGQSVSAAPPLDLTAPAEPLEEQKEEKTQRKGFREESEQSENRASPSPLNGISSGFFILFFNLFFVFLFFAGFFSAGKTLEWLHERRAN